MVQVLHTDTTLGSAVPLREYAVKVRARGILASKGPLDVHHGLLIHGFLKGERFVSRLLLSAPDGLLEALCRPYAHRLRHASSLVWVHGHIALTSLEGSLGSRVGIISREDLVSPLGFFKVLCLLIGDKNGCLRLLALSVIELEGCLALRIHRRACGSCHLETMLAHGPDISKLHGGVVAVLSPLVTLSPKVNI